jgi:2-polyprenyl-3-methyl-5-hydroxy-6-metoxy-1,4-benzoquinol methylase
MLDVTGRRTAGEAAQYYSEHANELLSRYEGVAFETVHANLLRYIPKRPGAALDVGAGSGRDAAWLAARGWSVVAAEPSKALRDGARRLHPDEGILWMNDALPDLARTRELKRKFDLILLSAVWMHVASEAEETALAALAELCAPPCIVAISIRMGGDETRRGFHRTDRGRLMQRAGPAGFSMIADEPSCDHFGRSGVAWTGLVLRCD